VSSTVNAEKKWIVVVAELYSPVETGLSLIHVLLLYLIGLGWRARAGKRSKEK
jgi:hypothetical protein